MPIQLNSDMFMLMEALQLLSNIISIMAIAALAFYLVGVTAMILGEKISSLRRAWSSTNWLAGQKSTSRNIPLKKLSAKFQSGFRTPQAQSAYRLPVKKLM